MKKKNFTKLAIGCMAAAALVLPFAMPRGVNVKAAIPTTEKVAELWNDDTKKFNSDNLLTLFKQVSGKDDFTFADYPTIYGLAAAKTTSAAFRRNAVSTKQAGDDITVTLGGLDWTPTYLSTDKNGNPILTLLLETPLTGAGGQSLSSQWATFFEGSDVTVTYPVSMYGVSYLRAVVLNNGGHYTNEKNATTTVEATPLAEHQLSAFTYDRKEGDGDTDIVDLKDFLVTPRDVAWQEDGQSSKNLGYISFKSSNDNWKKNQDNTDFRTQDEGAHYYNYSDRDYYDQWADDYIWLPSISEIGFFRQGTEHTGIWELSEAQRDFDDLNESNSYWLRTSLWESTSTALLMKNNGQEYTSANASNSHGVRPALHLNLSETALSTTSGEKVDFDISYSFKEGSTFSSEGLVIYNVYDNGLRIAVDEEFTCGVEDGTVLHEGDVITLRIGEEQYTYTVPKTQLEQGKFVATSTNGFGGTVAISLDVQTISSAQEIDEYLAESGQVLNNVSNIYTVKLLRGEQTLVDPTAVIKAKASDFGSNCNFYTIVDDALTQLTVDGEGYISCSGTEFVLLVQGVAAGGNQQGGGGAVTNSGNNSGLIIGLSCGLGAILLLTGGAVLYVFLRRRKIEKESEEK